jgi:hypothetical protein
VSELRAVAFTQCPVGCPRYEGIKNFDSVCRYCTDGGGLELYLPVPDCPLPKVPDVKNKDAYECLADYCAHCVAFVAALRSLT